MSFSLHFAGKVDAPGSGTTLVLPAYNQASGHCIVIGVVTYLCYVSSITDTAGNDSNYTPIYASHGQVSGSYTTQLFYVKNCLGNAANAVTLHLSGTAQYSGAFYYDITGADLSSPLDTTITFNTGLQTLQYSTPQPINTSSFATNYADEAVIVIAGAYPGYLIYASPTLSGGSAVMSLDGTAGQGGIQFAAESGVLSATVSAATAHLTAVGGNPYTWYMGGATFTAPNTYAISGTILDGSSNPIVGATVACTGQTSTTTAADGTYSFTGVSGSVTVTPTLTEWTFSPTNLVISSATSSANFTGTETFYSISGNAGVGGATVSWTAGGVFETELGGWFLLEGGGFLLLEGINGSVTADGSGNYTIPNLINDTYQIIPTKTGYSFSPISRSETVAGADITGVNFTANKAGGQVGAFLVGP